MLVAGWPAFGLGLAAPAWATILSITLLWIATGVTLITGWQYGAEAARALSRA